tara:strand:- start:80 stop:250 length:171 start_codon:yes stop_codon:yes gene_type:complete
MTLYFLVDENNVVTNASQDAEGINTVLVDSDWIQAPENATMEILGLTYDSESNTFA